MDILPGDGWDLSMRLYHPDENVGYTVSEKATFTYELAVYADPAILAYGPKSDVLYEGKEDTYSVTVRTRVLQLPSAYR